MRANAKAVLNKKLFFPISLLIQVFALILLATGSGLLIKPVFGGALPWGNLFTALLLTLFPLNFLMVQRSSTVAYVPLLVYRICVYLGFVLGAGWLFVSYTLAGNWSTTFHGEDTKQQIWTYYTYAAAISPFAGYFLMKLLSNFFKN